MGPVVLHFLLSSAKRLYFVGSYTTTHTQDPFQVGTRFDFFLLSSVRARYVLTISFGTAHFGIITQKREIFQAQIGLRFGLVF